MRRIEWCFSVKGGLKIVEPNENIALSYLNEAEKTLSKIKGLIDENDFLWASVRIYYCAYYSLYAFLQRIGVKSENHDCSISLAEILLGKDMLKNMNEFKEDRISSQYYLKAGKRDKLLKSYFLVKEFYLSFKKIVDEIKQDDLKEYIKKIKELKL